MQTSRINNIKSALAKRTEEIGVLLPDASDTDHCEQQRRRRSKTEEGRVVRGRGRGAAQKEEEEEEVLHGAHATTSQRTAG
jgi:hypothetical protein